MRPGIEARLEDFRRIGKTGTGRQLFVELVFCLFTPQSKAKSCWAAVETLKKKDLLFRGECAALAREMNTVRFRNNKARYVVLARQRLLRSLRSRLAAFPSSFEAREWLVRNVKGLGYKEASHFLRNIGRGEDIAILDRHILKNLKNAGVIPAVPPSMTRKNYLSIEKKMARFARGIGLPLSHLDLLLWCKETGEIFK
ncbi:MAG: N-glycosylase/DNA lyase [Endomicrobiales bacterium]